MDTSVLVSTVVWSARPAFQWVAGFLALTSLLFFSQSARAVLTPESVLVLYNSADADSQQIANYYAQKRPGVQLLGLTGVTTAEQVNSDYYLANIRPQVLAALDDSIDAIVTVSGLPLRIWNNHASPGTYVDPGGVERTIAGGSWSRFSSLESELARVDSISTWEQMGDQTVMNGPIPLYALNPYFYSNQEFSYGEFGTRLTSRLDGFSVADVEGMIDRSQKAFVGQGTPTDPFHFVIDDDPNAPGSTADHMESLRDNVLDPLGLPYTYDGTNAFIQDPVVANPSLGKVIGYVTHGTQGGAPVEYLEDPVDGIHFELANGAVFHSWESFNAKTFNPAASQTQGLVGEWIARGGTAALGHVAEPFVSVFTVSHGDILFDRLLNGMSWAEAAWAATVELSYVNTVVGDPLMRFRPWLPGDANLDGAVNLFDLIILQDNWLLAGDLNHGDFDGDGQVNLFDLILLQDNWLQTVDEYGNISQATTTLPPYLDPESGAPMASIPEPATVTLLWLGILLPWWRVHRQA